MSEYIEREAAEDAAGEAYLKGLNPEWAVRDVPTADVVPASQERIYKDLLDVLLEDIRSLDATLIDACCMCSKGECDDCNLRTFEDELSAILERAAERKKRLTD